MAALLWPQTEDEFGAVTQRFLEELARRRINAVSDYTPEERTQLIDTAATLIRMADELLARDCPADRESDDLCARLNTARNLAMAMMVLMNPEQAWFWTPQWQAREREADRAIAEGSGTFYATGEDFLASLEARS